VLCVDIDECETVVDACKSGQCINTAGSFRCQCPLGFVLHRDAKTCVGRWQCVTVVKSSRPMIASAQSDCLHLYVSFYIDDKLTNMCAKSSGFTRLCLKSSHVAFKK